MNFSGCRDGVIHHHDVRKAEHIVAQSQYHQLEVCGLKWSPDGTKLASGGNDNLVCIWNASNPSEPAQVLRGHQAAVKVSFCLLTTWGWGRVMVHVPGLKQCSSSGITKILVNHL